MPQETSKEFSYRLNQAVEGHPSAPPTPFGRQSWLKEKLETETGLRVSNNSLSKWFNGLSTPRPDNIRKVAQVLSVDEVWLGSGRKPETSAREKGLNHTNARGGALALAGLVEMQGGRVTFPDHDDDQSDLHINLGGTSFAAIVVSPKETDDAWSFIVSEPLGDVRILSVTATPKSDCGSSACLTILDLTGCPRQSLGGYSVITLARRKDGKFNVEGQRALLSSVASLEELA